MKNKKIYFIYLIKIEILLNLFLEFKLVIICLLIINKIYMNIYYTLLIIILNNILKNKLLLMIMVISFKCVLLIELRGQPLVSSIVDAVTS